MVQNTEKIRSSKTIMKCGVKFCGGCNPRYQRGEAYRFIKAQLPQIDFEYAQEGTEYDHLLVIGGCPACCPGYSQYTVRNDVIRMWDAAHIEYILTELKSRLDLARI